MESNKPTRIKRRRDPLSPMPILDKKLLVGTLRERGIILKEKQIDVFYQLLHRYHYPSLSDFVKLYYKSSNSTNKPKQKQKSGVTNDDSALTAQVMKRPLKNPISSHNMLNCQLPKAFLDFLADPMNDFTTITSSIASKHTSLDNTTTKLAIRLQDDHVVESVIMRHMNKSGSRATLCVSSQVGCAMGCTFCSTGTMGIRGNLCQGEILEQIVHADCILAEESAELNMGHTVKTMRSGMNQSLEIPKMIRNVVFMGMGEPLNNYENVLEACRGMIDNRRWNLAHGKVTVSTVGVTPKMRQLTKDLPEINLALSLHAPNQPMREVIVPTAKMYPIEDMIEALDEHMMVPTKSRIAEGASPTVDQRKNASKRKRAMIEYVMLEGPTSTFECAHQLGKLCENRHLVVNLIPYNKTDVKDELRCPSQEHIKEFQRIVSSYGSLCYVRKTMGADIAGACGQLVKEQESNSIGDIEDGPSMLMNESKESKNKVKEVGRMKKSLEKRTKETFIQSFDNWVTPLSYATLLAASCLVASSLLLVSSRRR